MRSSQKGFPHSLCGWRHKNRSWHFWDVSVVFGEIFWESLNDQLSICTSLKYVSLRQNHVQSFITTKIQKHSRELDMQRKSVRFSFKTTEKGLWVEMKWKLNRIFLNLNSHQPLKTLKNLGEHVSQITVICPGSTSTSKALLLYNHRSQNTREAPCSTQFQPV